MLLSTLLGKEIRDDDGTTLGRVVEVRAKNSRVEALICGGYGLLQRLANFRTGKRIPWSDIRSIEADFVLCRRRRRWKSKL
jgi:sporulation protein YlmC with PRC-barrel domain